MAPPHKRTSMRAKSKASSASARPAKSPRDAISHPRRTFVAPPTIATSLKPKPDGYVEYDEDAAWKTTKKDKRAMKHNVLMNKVRDAGVRKSKPRRPNRKLKTDLEGLADALPEIEGMADGSGSGDEDEWEGVEESEDGEGMAMDGMGDGLRKRRRRVKKVHGQDGKMELKSLKHKPGAMKRKRALEARETERFGKNLAQLVGSVKKGSDLKSAAAATGGDGSSADQSAAQQGGSAQADRWAALRGFIGGSMQQNPAFVKG